MSADFILFVKTQAGPYPALVVARGLESAAGEERMLFTVYGLQVDPGRQWLVRGWRGRGREGVGALMTAGSRTV